MKWVAHIVSALWLTVVGLVVSFGYMLGAAAPSTTSVDFFLGAIESVFVFALFGAPALLWFGYQIYKDYK